MLLSSHRLLFLFLLLLSLLLSRNWWQSHMALHMTGQIPLLVILGGLYVNHQYRQFAIRTKWGRRYRASLLLFALFTLSLWMLPRLLDGALHQWDIALLKWITLPMAGAALVLCWPHLPVVLRAVLHLEAIATLLRLGWLYLLAPQGYCVSYGLDEQQLTGYVLIAYGIAYALILGISVMMGQRQPETSRSTSLSL